MQKGPDVPGLSWNGVTPPVPVGRHPEP